MFSSLSNLSSSVGANTSSSSTSSATTEILSAIQSQSLEEKVPLTSKEKVERKLASILTQVQQNQVKHLNLTSIALGRFYELANTLDEHQAEVRCLAVLENGALVSGSGDRTIKIWDVATHSCIATLRGHTDVVWSLAVLPNGLLLSGSGDATIKLWNLATHSCLSTLEGHSESVLALAVLPNGLLASGSWDKTIKLWNLESHSYLATLQGHTNGVYALVALPNGLLASGSWDHTVKLWDSAAHSCRATLQGHTNGVYALVALPNGLLASGSWDHTIKLWDLASHSCPSTLQGHTSFINALVALPNGLLASGSWDYTIKLWDLASRSYLSVLREHIREVLALAILPDGQIASGSWDHTIKLWEFKTLSTKQLSPILNALKNNTSVTALDLSHNVDIRDDIIDPLINIFKKPGLFSFLSSKPNTTLKTLDLRRTGVSKKGLKKLEKLIQCQRLSVKMLADCPIEWMMIYFLIIFCRANRNSPFADSGLDLCKHGEIGLFLGVPSGLFARLRKISYSFTPKCVTPSPI